MFKFAIYAFLLQVSVMIDSTWKKKDKFLSMSNFHPNLWFLALNRLLIFNKIIAIHYS